MTLSLTVGFSFFIFLIANCTEKAMLNKAFIAYSNVLQRNECGKRPEKSTTYTPYG